MGWWRNPHGQYVVTSTLELPRYIKYSASECALDATQARAVQPHFGVVVDSVERKRELPAIQVGWSLEGGAIPIVLPAQAFGNGHVVQAIGRIGVDAARYQCGEYRARNHCLVPTTVIKLGHRDLRPIGRYARRLSQSPCTDGP